MINETFLTTVGVAEWLCTTKRNIDAWCNEGRLTYTKVGNKRLFPKSGIVKILERNLQEAIQ
jgi:excisionase family DNA binding protein